MLTKSQIARILGLAVVLWLVATLYIRFVPSAFAHSMRGDLAYLASLPVAWLSVRLIQRVARLETGQLVIGTSLTGAAAMTIDGAVLHWLPAAYGTDDTIIRFGAAWLLWGYGVSLAAALLMARPARYPVGQVSPS